MAVDLKRSTGYHRLDVDRSTFWFATEDAKLGLEGVEAMLAELRTVGTGWTGQALFSDGSGLRDPHVLYAWLDQWSDPALEAVRAVLAAPRATSTTTRALSRRGGPKVLVPQTMRLLRSAPQRHLVASPAGLLSVGNQRYDPLRVVVRRRTTTLDSIANRRAVGLLGWMVRLLQEVLSNELDSNTRARCRLWLNAADTLHRRPLAQRLRVARFETAPRQSEETMESRYRTTYDIARDLRRQFGWSANIQPMPRYSYVNYADLIYQAYTASCMAAALGLTQTSEVLGAVSPAFSGPDFDLYFDCECPPDVIRSWRAGSQLPDKSRPDVLLHERSSGRVAILDAKYRIDKGQATEDSRKELTSYLGLYGLKSVTLIFPGDSTTTGRVLTGSGRTIIELPMKPPGPHVALDGLLAAVLSGLEVPPY